MKRIIVICIATLSCLSMSAQQKGDMYIAASASASFGVQGTKTFDGVSTEGMRRPTANSASASAEFGFFVVDHLRLALGIGVPFLSSPIGETYHRNQTVAFLVNPNVAYYIRLADGLYYTPEIGFAYQVGAYKEELSAQTSYNANYGSWQVYLNYLALEYKINRKFALGVGIGAVSYGAAHVKDKASAAYVKNELLNVNLNSASVHVRFYL